MEHYKTRNPTRKTINTIDAERFGVSLSIKQCREFNIDSIKVLTFLINTVGFRRFRLMSYWNEHEIKQGNYDFSKLDQQIKLIEDSHGVITLCLGVRQPRWPESHWPDWALKLPQEERYEALFTYIKTVVKRYKNRACIVSWQLENEALNRSFGENGDFNRERLRHEYNLVKYLNPKRPIIMTTSNTWGIPLLQPRPEIFGFTLYQVQYQKETYTRSKLPIWWWSFRAKIIKLLTLKNSFIHELQAEPWGPKAIWEMPIKEQGRSMNIEQLKTNISFAKQTGLYPIDLWGGEWWYWRHKQGDDTIYKTITKHLTSDTVY